jgi:hypothetical protein
LKLLAQRFLVISISTQAADQKILGMGKDRWVVSTAVSPQTVHPAAQTTSECSFSANGGIYLDAIALEGIALCYRKRMSWPMVLAPCSVQSINV